VRFSAESFNPCNFAPHLNLAIGQSLGLIYNTFSNYNGTPGFGPGEPFNAQLALKIPFRHRSEQ
jgi:hypothetical protein